MLPVWLAYEVEAFVSAIDDTGKRVVAGYEKLSIEAAVESITDSLMNPKGEV